MEPVIPNVNVFVNQQVAYGKSYFFFKEGDGGQTPVHESGDVTFPSGRLQVANSVPGYSCVWLFAKGATAQVFSVTLNGSPWFTVTSTAGNHLSPPRVFQQDDIILTTLTV